MLLWAKKYKNSSLKENQNILWTNELKFELFGKKENVCEKKYSKKTE